MLHVLSVLLLHSTRDKSPNVMKRGRPMRDKRRSTLPAPKHLDAELSLPPGSLYPARPEVQGTLRDRNVTTMSSLSNGGETITDIAALKIESLRLGFHQDTHESLVSSLDGLDALKQHTVTLRW